MSEHNEVSGSRRWPFTAASRWMRRRRAGAPVYRTSSYVFPSTERAANLFALKELGNIYHGS